MQVGSYARRKKAKPALGQSTRKSLLGLRSARLVSLRKAFPKRRFGFFLRSLLQYAFEEGVSVEWG